MKGHEYICVILFTLICIAIPFIWYHLSREDKKDVILPGQPCNQAQDEQSNTSCQFWQIIGDNYCDDEANVLQCRYDSYDCCNMDSDRSLCTDCFCYIPEDEKIVLEDQFKNKNEPFEPPYSNPSVACSFLGDGLCDLPFNNKENYFDVGDCCQENIVLDDDCPENVCIESNIFCIEEELGDGICQGHNNGPFCEYDLGDCCLVTGSHMTLTSQSNCTCNCTCTGQFFNDHIYCYG